MKSSNNQSIEIKDLLEKNNIKPSFQRIRILEFLMKNNNHPSVDNVYKSLSREIPTLSKTTVYNTLKKLSKKGIIQQIKIDKHELRYDYIKAPHAHFKCRICGNIYDIDLNTDLFYIKKIGKHKIYDVRINFSGICSNCLNNKTNLN